MLKERDKKLLFYSWSYAILAFTFINVICGYGAMAEYTLIDSGQHTGTGNSYFTAYGATKDWQMVFHNWSTSVSDGASWVHFSNITTYYSGSVTCDWTGNLNTELRTGAGGTGDYCGDVNVIWDFGSHLNTNLVEGGTVDIYFSNLTLGGDCADGSNYYLKYALDASNMNASSNCPKIRTKGSSSGYISPLEMRLQTQAGYPTNLSYALYSGQSTPDAPVINDFTSDATCYAPAEAIVLESNVTGTVDSWLWEIYDSSDVQVWSSADSVETIVDEVFSPGLYQVQLYVENTGGNDFLSKDNWLNITQSGNCLPINNWTNPFPTLTVTPDVTMFPTITMPPITNWNMTGVNDLINQSSLGNASIGYRQYWDKMAEQVNSTLLGSVYVIITPFSGIVGAVSGGLTLFATAFNSIIGYTTVPLQVVSIAISGMPWQIVTLITAGIAIDAILILVLGVR